MVGSTGAILFFACLILWNLLFTVHILLNNRIDRKISPKWRPSPGDHPHGSRIIEAARKVSTLRNDPIKRSLQHVSDVTSFVCRPFRPKRGGRKLHVGTDVRGDLNAGENVRQRWTTHKQMVGSSRRSRRR